MFFAVAKIVSKNDSYRACVGERRPSIDSKEIRMWGGYH